MHLRGMPLPSWEFVCFATSSLSHKLFAVLIPSTMSLSLSILLCKVVPELHDPATHNSCSTAGLRGTHLTQSALIQAGQEISHCWVLLTAQGAGEGRKWSTEPEGPVGAIQRPSLQDT